MKPQTINVHIERLILDDFGAFNGQDVGAAVSAELTRLLSHAGVPSAWHAGGHLATLDGGTIQIVQMHNAQTLGNHIGQLVYKGMAR